MTPMPGTTDGAPLRLSQLQHRDDGGMVCRACGCRHFRVLYTRPDPRGGLRRRRECRHCGRRITTWEKEISFYP